MQYLMYMFLSDINLDEVNFNVLKLIPVPHETVVQIYGNIVFKQQNIKKYIILIIHRIINNINNTYNNNNNVINDDNTDNFVEILQH